MQDVHIEQGVATSAAGPPGVEARRRVSAVASLGRGTALETVADEAEVPPDTVLRWKTISETGGHGTLIGLAPPISLQEEFTSEVLALLAYEAHEGLEKTVYSALARAYRGSSYDELRSYYRLEEGEIENWVEVFRAFGPEAVPVWFSGRSRRIDDDGVGRLRLSTKFGARFLRRLHERASGVAKARLLMVALAYEGRTPTQIAEALGTSLTTVRHAMSAFRRNGVYGLSPAISKAVHIPARRDFAAGDLEYLAFLSPLPALSRRLRVVADAYRGTPWRDIAESRETSLLEVRRYVWAFERDGLEGLETGEATPTPALRGDYDGAGVRAYAEDVANSPQRMKLLAIARLYDGEPMNQVAQSCSGMNSLRIWVDAFNREGLRFPEPFNAARQAPSPPPTRPVPMPEVQLPAHLIGAYMEHARSSALQKLKAVRDLAAGDGVAEVCERHEVDEAKLRQWVVEANEHRIRWLTLSQTASWIEGECLSMLRDGVHPAKVAATVGVDEEYVAVLVERASLTDALEAVRAAAPDLQNLLQAERSWSEPLATYAKAIYALLKTKRPEKVAPVYALHGGELLRVVEAFASRGVAGLACDPAGLSASKRSRAAAAKRGIKFGARPPTVSISERISSYLHLAEGRGGDALKAVALASEGVPLSIIMRTAGASEAEVREWISRFNSTGSYSFLAPEKKNAATEELRNSAEVLTLAQLETAVSDGLLARNVAIVSRVAAGGAIASACDAFGVTYGFARACVDAYVIGRLAGLATVPRHSKEMDGKAPDRMTRPQEVAVVDDLAWAADAVKADKIEAEPPTSVADKTGRQDAPQLPEWRRTVRSYAKQRQVPAIPDHIHEQVAIHLYPDGGAKPGAMVALTRHAISFETKKEAVSGLLDALNLAAKFGSPGIIMVGWDYRGGDDWRLTDDMIFGGDDIPKEAFLREISRKLDEDAIPAIRRAKDYSWFLIPFFRASIEPDEKRHRLLNAQLEAHDYSLVEEGQTTRLWMPSTVSMSKYGPTYRLREVSPDIARAPNPKEIYDLVSEG